MTPREERITRYALSVWLSSWVAIIGIAGMFHSEVLAVAFLSIGMIAMVVFFLHFDTDDPSDA